MFRKFTFLLAITMISTTISACSPARMAADLAGNAMASGGDVYASEEDPELLMAALPFGLKTMEGLLTSSPDNANLRLAAARGFTAYAFLVQRAQDGDLSATTAERRAHDHRVARLFLRGHDHAMAGLEARHPGFATSLRADREAALARTDPADTELLYWAGAAWIGAISADKRDLGMVAALPIAASLVIRTVELDDAFDGGAAHELLMLYEAGRAGGTLDAAEVHYRRAIEFSGDTSAGAHVGYAEVIAVARQDRVAFRRALDAALAVDPDTAPERRLTNVLAQRKARRLSEQEDLLFLVPEGDIS